VVVDFFFSSRRRHTRCYRDWSSDVCSSDLIVETLQMGTRDSHINASDHHVALLFGIDYRFVHAFHCRFEIDDLSLAHAARWRLTHTEDFDGAVGTAFANNDTDLRRANLKTDHQFIARPGS